MPRHPDSQTHVLYDLQRRWLAEVVPSEGTLLLPADRQVWTSDNMEEVRLRLAPLAGPGERTGKYLDDLHDRFEGAAPEAIGLVAELHLVHYFPFRPGAVSGRAKVSSVEAILSWMPEPAVLPEDIAAALQQGVAHPGQWVVSRRAMQLLWLLDFTGSWAALDDGRRQQALDDPWVFRALAEQVDAALGARTGLGTSGTRLATMHLTHPDTFERVLTEAHKVRISERFANLAGEDTDIDRRLVAVRRGLEAEAGEAIDFYLGDMKLRWQERPAGWSELLLWLQRVRELPQFDEWERDYKLELAERLGEARTQLRSGSDEWPSTIRKGLQRANLTDFRSDDTFTKWAAAEPADASAALTALWDDDGSPWRRLDRFVELVPDDVLDTPGKRRNVGSVLLMAEDPSTRPPIKVTLLRNAFQLAGWPEDDKGLSDGELYRRALFFFEELVRDGANWRVPLRDPLDAQSAVWTVLNLKEKPDGWTDEDWEELVVFRSGGDEKVGPQEKPDGSGPIIDPEPPWDSLERAATDLHVEVDDLQEIVDLLDDKGQAILYGPPGTGKTYLALRLARAIAEGDESRVALVQFHPATTYEDFIEGLRPRLTDAGQVTYEVVAGPLVRMAELARQDPEHTYVLVVDEINRANLPKVFGELLFLLEYRDEAVYTLHRHEEPFGLPANLQILATMNTADRSIALIDAAMRRRFHFVPFFPHQGMMRGLLDRWLDHRGGRAGVGRLLEAVNEELQVDLGDHLLIGPSHFMGKSDLSDTALERIWTYNVFPLLEEQYWGDADAIERWRWPSVRRRFAGALDGTAPPGQSEPGDPAASGDATDEVRPGDEPAEQ